MSMEEFDKNTELDRDEYFREQRRQARMELKRKRLMPIRKHMPLPLYIMNISSQLITFDKIPDISKHTSTAYNNHIIDFLFWQFTFTMLKLITNISHERTSPNCHINRQTHKERIMCIVFSKEKSHSLIKGIGITERTFYSTFTLIVKHTSRKEIIFVPTL